MKRENVRFVIQGTLREALAEAKRRVAELEKRAREENGRVRTRGLILMGAALIENVGEEKREALYERLIDLDAIVRNRKSTPEQRNEAKCESRNIAVALASGNVTDLPASGRR